MKRPLARRPGAAALALLVILLITAAWWALALWPVGELAPEWLLRTRAACFGSLRGGLPDAGGWILLVGQPLGMLGFLLAVWGGPLRDDLRHLGAEPRWRMAGVGLLTVALLALGSAGRVVARARALGVGRPTAVPGVPLRVDLDVSAIVLTDQHGQRVSLGALRQGPALLGFAYGHCGTVCPTLVHALLAARQAAHQPQLPLVVVTLDPWRDTPERLPSLAAQWGLAPEDRVLSGSIAEVERALDRLAVGRRRDESTGDITHVATVMLLDARGHLVWRLDGGWGRVGELLTRPI